MGGSRSIKWILTGNSLAVQWLGLRTLTAEIDMSLEREIFKKLVHMTRGGCRVFCFFLNNYFFFKNYLFYLFLAVLGLCCCARAFSSCGERRLLFVAVHRLLIAVASLVVEHGL